MNRYLIALTLSGALALGACKKDPPADIPLPPRDTVAPAPTPAPAPQTGSQPGSQGHFSTAMAGADTIYFNTDEFNVDTADAAALRRQAEYLTQYPSARAQVPASALASRYHAEAAGFQPADLSCTRRARARPTA